MQWIQTGYAHYKSKDGRWTIGQFPPSKKYLETLDSKHAPKWAVIDKAKPERKNTTIVNSQVAAIRHVNWVLAKESKL